MSSEAEIRKRKIYRVTFVGFVVNLVLSVLKLAAGIVGWPMPSIRSPTWRRMWW